MRKLNKNPLNIKQNYSLKAKVEWAVLILLLLTFPFAIWSNLASYGYHYLRCEGEPAEIFGNYYRIPYDEGYGIHPGSDYSDCSWVPEGKIRDLSTRAGGAQAKNNQQSPQEYELYFPAEYSISNLSKMQLGNRSETIFEVTTNAGVTFSVRELDKDSDFSYTNLCAKSAGEHWSGTVIGKDAKGREVCRVNTSKYIKDYIVGVNIGRTGIMLRTAEGSEEVLNSEAIKIFGSMEPFLN